MLLKERQQRHLHHPGVLLRLVQHLCTCITWQSDPQRSHLVGKFLRMGVLKNWDGYKVLIGTIKLKKQHTKSPDHMMQARINPCSVGENAKESLILSVRLHGHIHSCTSIIVLDQFVIFSWRIKQKTQKQFSPSEKDNDLALIIPL